MLNEYRTRFFSILALLTFIPVVALEPVPDKLVVLTFDDSAASQYTIVRPLLKQHKFGATFFITMGFDFQTDKTNYMTWQQIRELHQDGFEIGNHTRDHRAVTRANLPRLKEQIEVVNAHFLSNGIPRAKTFAWPGNALTVEALGPLRELGILFARRGGAPEFPYDEGRGHAYEPVLDHPLLIPSAGDARPAWKLEDFIRAVEQAKNGKIAVLQFHGVPDLQHPWVSTPPELFEQYMNYLHEQRFKVISLGALKNYVDLELLPIDAMKIVEERKARLAAEREVKPSRKD